MLAPVIELPHTLLPSDGRFGSGPAKVRPEALEYLTLRGDLMGTSHRHAPVKGLVRAVRDRLAELYRIPPGYEVVLGNGGASAVWDLAVCSLVERRSAHGVYGEFSRKFAAAAASAPHVDAVVTEAAAGGVALPEPCDADTYAWAHNETSTGAAAPVERIGDGLVLLDATSAAGGIDADIAQTDLYYFAPQKNFSSDGGLWLAFASPAAIERAQRIKESGRWLPATLDFTLAVENSRKDQTLNTPAIATLILLEEQLRWMLELGGMPAVAARCAESSGILYDWAARSGFASPFVADHANRSPVVATIDLAPEVDGTRLIAELRANGIVDVDPYRALKRNQLRVGCYASVEPSDVEALTGCIDYLVDRL